MSFNSMSHLLLSSVEAYFIASDVNVDVVAIIDLFGPFRLERTP